MTTLNLLMEAEIKEELGEKGVAALRHVAHSIDPRLSLVESFERFGKPYMPEDIEVTPADYDEWLDVVLDMCKENGCNPASKRSFYDTAFEMLDNDSKVDMLGGDLELAKRNIADVLWHNQQLRRGQSKIGKVVQKAREEEEARMAAPVDGDTEFSVGVRDAAEGLADGTPYPEDDDDDSADSAVDTLPDSESDDQSNFAEDFMRDHPEVLDMEPEELTQYLFQNHPDMTLGQVLELDDALMADDVDDVDVDVDAESNNGLEVDLGADEAEIDREGDGDDEVTLNLGKVTSNLPAKEEEERKRPLPSPSKKASPATEKFSSSSWVSQIVDAGRKAAKRDAKDGRKTSNPYLAGTSRHGVWKHAYATASDLRANSVVSAKEEEETVNASMYSKAMSDGHEAARKYFDKVQQWAGSRKNGAVPPPANPYPTDSAEGEAWESGFDSYLEDMQS